MVRLRHPHPNTPRLLGTCESQPTSVRLSNLSSSSEGCRCCTQGRLSSQTMSRLVSSRPVNLSFNLRVRMPHYVGTAATGCTAVSHSQIVHCVTGLAPLITCKMPSSARVAGLGALHTVCYYSASASRTNMHSSTPQKKTHHRYDWFRTASTCIEITTIFSHSLHSSARLPKAWLS